jgi:hypothetical protein
MNKIFIGKKNHTENITNLGEEVVTGTTGIEGRTNMERRRIKRKEKGINRTMRVPRKNQKKVLTMTEKELEEPQGKVEISRGRSCAEDNRP